MERAVFVQRVLSAVGHLDDSTELSDHPLALFLFPGRTTNERGRELADLLRAAIDELRPADVTETNLAALRRYQYLDLRYRRGLRASHVARDLGLSDRQARRIHQEAIEALAGVVWAQRQRITESATRLTPATGSVPEPAPASDLEVEIIRLGATPSLDGTSLSEALRSALGTVTPLATRHEVDIEVVPLAPLSLIAIDRAVLRQVLVNLLVALIETGVRRLDVSAQAGREAVEVTFTTHFRSMPIGQPNDQLQHDELLRVVQRLVQLQAGSVEVQTLDRAKYV